MISIIKIDINKTEYKLIYIYYINWKRKKEKS